MINDNVTSDLRYCYSLLYGAKQPNIDLLQCCKIESMLFTYKEPISAVLRNIS